MIEKAAILDFISDKQKKMIKICAILLLFASFLSHAASFKNGQFLKRVVQESEKVLLPLTERLTSIKSAVNRSNVSTSCQESLSRLIESVRDHGRWAFEGRNYNPNILP